MAITSFRGEYRFLSNFYWFPVTVFGNTWRTAEHAFQAAKTSDQSWKIKVWETTNAADAKKLGRKLPIRKNWDEVKLQVMEEIIRRKFSYPELADKLRETGSQELVEGNTWNDKFWGVCNGKGENHLGKILMKIRSEL